MLNSIRKGACALVAAATLTATAAQAEEHVILIVDGSYFPSVVFASEGDMLTFQNESQSDHTVSGADDAWTSGVIGSAGTFSIDLTEETPAVFSGASAGAEEAVGEIIFQ